MQKLKERQRVQVKVVAGKSERVAVRVCKELQPQVRTVSFGLVFLG